MKDYFIRRESNAFTLVETLVVVTIFSFVGLALATSFMTGIKLWDRARKTDAFQYSNLLAWEMIAKELRQSLNYTEIGFEIKPQEFTFPTLIGDTIVQVTYAYDSQKKELLRKELDLASIIAVQENIKEKAVLTSLEEFRLSYYYHYFDQELNREVYLWKEVQSDADAWTRDKGPFAAIKLEGKLKDEPFSKTVIIPIS